MMKKSNMTLACAICFLSLFNFAYSASDSADSNSSDDTYFVEGKVYCDTCRVQFVTRISTYLKGAEVQLECKEREGGSVIFRNSTTTDEKGGYIIPISGDYEEDICEVVLVKSPDSECSDVSHDSHQEISARVSITGNNGIADPIREANPLGFLRKEPLPECKEVLRELGFTDDGGLV